MGKKEFNKLIINRLELGKEYSKNKNNDILIKIYKIDNDIEKYYKNKRVKYES